MPRSNRDAMACLLFFSHKVPKRANSRLLRMTISFRSVLPLARTPIRTGLISPGSAKHIPPAWPRWDSRRRVLSQVLH